MTSWEDADGNTVVENTYDSSDRVTEQKDANGNSSKLSYRTGMTVTTDNLGNKTTYYYDEQYRTTQILYADGAKETKQYDAENHLAASTDAAGNTTSYQYDANGNLTREERADGTARSMEYDSAGNLIKEVDYNGNTTTYRYGCDKIGLNQKTLI